MKKQVLALAAILTLATLTTTAQKGSKFVTGTVSYSKTTDLKSSYSLSPTLGYYVTDKVSVGLVGELGRAGDATTTNVGLFGRCDFLTINKNCQVFSQVDVSFNKTTTAGVDAKSTVANLGLGANYFITKKLGLTMNVADLITYTRANGVSTTTVGFTGVNNPLAATRFGIIYKF